MKILVISLLRVGDLAMTAPVLRDLRASLAPGAKLDLLVNSQSLQVAKLLPSIDSVHVFERDTIQKGLGDPAVPFFESYERLSSLLDVLNAQSYDTVINLTHTRLSGWIASLVQANRRVGLSFDQEGKATFGSNWFRYLNAQVEADGKDIFHYNDVFRFALGVQPSGGDAFKETQEGKEEAQAILAKKTNPESSLICVQALTSDTKKDWNLKSYARALKAFNERHSNVAVAVLAAPFEEQKLKPFVEDLRATGIDAFIAVTSFAGAFSLLKKSKLLITLDTSIKHLAAAAHTPILEVCLGSSDPYRTGAYRDGAVVVSSKETCAPCVHSRACHRERRFCDEKIPSDAIAMLASELYEKRSFQLSMIAESYGESIEVRRVRLKDAPFWTLGGIEESFTEANVGRLIDLTSRKIWLSGLNRSVDGVGHEIFTLSRMLRSMYPKTSEIEWRHVLSDFERQLMMIEGRVNSFKTGIRVLHGAYEDTTKLGEFVRGLIALREKIKPSPLMTSFKISLDQAIEDDISPAFTRFRRITDIVNEIDKRATITLRIIRSLGQQLDSANEAEHL